MNEELDKEFDTKAAEIREWCADRVNHALAPQHQLIGQAEE